MNAQQFSQRIDQARESYTGDGWWSGECPAHDDENPSLGWKDGAVKVVIKCQAGCSRQEVLKELGLTEDDTWLEPRPKAGGGKEVAATYDYRDEAGDLLFQAVRYRRPNGKKTFSLRRPDPDDADSWVYDIKNTRMVLYRLDAIQGGKRVVVVEGEKDADRLALTGLVATTIVVFVIAYVVFQRQEIRA